MGNERTGSHCFSMLVFKKSALCGWYLIAVLSVMFAFGCNDASDSEPRAHVDDLRYRLLPGDARILTGTFVNDSEETIEVAQIDVSLFDDDNRRISSMMILVQGVLPGESKDFREPVVTKLNIHGARVRSILIP